MYQQCIDQQIPPQMRYGDTCRDGEFFRNLRKEHVRRRYQEDDHDQPEYGYTLHKSHWRYWDRQRSGLSANLQSCIHSEVCSIALHPDGEDYFHVARIDLGAINRSGLLSSHLAAQYEPHPPNLCHFVIVPLDGVATKWMELRNALDALSPRAKSLPVSDEEKAKERAAYEKHRSLIDVCCWVRNEDGSLQR